MIENQSIVKKCPFCGKTPFYNAETQLVHCETVDCAVGDFYIHIDEWNVRCKSS